MLTEQDYLEVLTELDFDMIRQVGPSESRVGAALRHKYRRTIGVSQRRQTEGDAF